MKETEEKPPIVKQRNKKRQKRCQVQIRGQGCRCCRQAEIQFPLRGLIAHMSTEAQNPISDMRQADAEQITQGSGVVVMLCR